MNDIKIFAKTVESSVYGQIQRMMSLDAFRNAKIRIMPDTHAGMGCVIGFTAALGEKVVPNLVGVNIAAGRLMSRSAAKESISMDDFRVAMKGIYTTSVNKNTIDESPMAYKNAEEIVEMVAPTIDVVEVIKPIYNFKASETEEDYKRKDD